MIRFKSVGHHKLNNPNVRRQRGTAAVELAICMPILVTVMLATIEACTMMHTQQSLKISAFEGARVGTVPGAEATNVTYQCETLLDDHSFADAADKVVAPASA